MEIIAGPGGRALAFYRSNWQDAAAPLLLLHGFCEDASVWDEVAPGLGDIPILRIDLPGFGGSEAPDAGTMDGYVAAVKAVIDHLGVERLVLAGHSMGGYTALAFAAQYPDRLAGLGLVHSHPYADSPDRVDIRRRGIALLQEGKKDLYVAQLFPGLFTPEFVRDNAAVVQQLIEQGCGQSTQGIIGALEAMIGRLDHVHTLETATCPVLCLLGREDQLVPVAQAQEWIHRPKTADIHLLQGVAHMSMFEARDRAVQILSDFYRFCVEQDGATP